MILHKVIYEILDLSDLAVAIFEKWTKWIVRPIFSG